MKKKKKKKKKKTPLSPLSSLRLTGYLRTVKHCRVAVDLQLSEGAPKGNSNDWSREAIDG